MNALLRPFRNISGAILAFLLPLAAWAQTSNPNPVTLGVIKEAASRTSDKSREALISIFGEVVNDPLAITGGAGDTVLASIFKVTNGAMSVIGAIFVCYILFNRLANTAHDGAVFDRDKVTLWEPIRVVWGFATLVPTVNGWSLAQLLMLWAAAIIGVGTANLGVDAALAAFEDGKSMVVQPVAPDTLDLSRSLFENDLCMHGVNASLKQAEESGSLVKPDSYVTQRPTDTGFTLENSSFVCGDASVNVSAVDDLTSAFTSSNRINPVNANLGVFAPVLDLAYIRLAHIDALTNMQNNLSLQAHVFVDAVRRRQLDEAVDLPDVRKILRDAADTYEVNINKVLKQAEGDIAALAKMISDSIKDGGWWMLGAWYQTFAQANTRLADAVAAKASTSGIHGSGDPGMMSTYYAALKAYRAQMQLLRISNPTPLGETPPITISYKENPTDVAEIMGSIAGSPFRNLVAQLTDWDDEGLVNPIIRAKNFGDNLMGFTEILAAAYSGMKAINAAVPDNKFSDAAKQFLPSPGSTLVKAGASILEDSGEFLRVLFIGLFILGAVLSIYVPFVPFIVWFGAIINWLVVVGEAVVAAPLWAMIHLAGEGDGFGHKTSHGYIFLLNCMVRPILMVIGFFLGGAAVVAGGTVLNQMFKVAFVNVQFDSITGAISLFGFVAVYIMMMLTLIHSCFNLILIVPDQVINWVGGHASPALGRDDNERARHMFGALVHRAETSLAAKRFSKGSDTNMTDKGIKKGALR